MRQVQVGRKHCLLSNAENELIVLVDRNVGGVDDRVLRGVLDAVHFKERSHRVANAEWPNQDGVVKAEVNSGVLAESVVKEYSMCKVTSTFAQTHMHVHTYTYTHKHIHKHTHTHTHKHTCKHIHTCKQGMGGWKVREILRSKRV